MARSRKSGLKGYGLIAGILLAGAYFSVPIMTQVHKFVPSLHPVKK